MKCFLSDDDPLACQATSFKRPWGVIFVLVLFAAACFVAAMGGCATCEKPPFSVPGMLESFPGDNGAPK